MSRRLYLSAAVTAEVTPVGQGEGYWDTEVGVTHSALLRSPSASDTMASFTASFTTDVLTLMRRFTGPQMVAGITFSGGAAVKCYSRCMQLALTDNVLTAFAVYIVDAAGTTIRTRLIGPASYNVVELSTNVLVNKRFSGPPIVTPYTTVSGDRPVVDLGWYADAGTTPQATIRLGSSGAADLPENETELLDLRPWVEFATDVVFMSDASVIALDGSYSASMPVEGSYAANMPMSGSYNTGITLKGSV